MTRGDTYDLFGPPEAVAANKAHRSAQALVEIIARDLAEARASGADAEGEDSSRDSVSKDDKTEYELRFEEPWWVAEDSDPGWINEQSQEQWPEEDDVNLGEPQDFK